MCVVNIFSGEFCQGQGVTEKASEALGFRLVTDQDLITQTAASSGWPEKKLYRALYEKASVFNQFSHEKERGVSQLKVSLAELMQSDGLIFSGYASLLVPRNIPRVLNVCLIAETLYRVQCAEDKIGITGKEALLKIHKADASAMVWTEFLGKRDPWGSELYDILIPMHKTSVDQAVELITAHANSLAQEPSNLSSQAVGDFLLAARVEKILTEAGHNSRDAQVSCRGDYITIQINKKVFMLNRLEEELISLANKVDGVKDVSIVPGPGYYQADVYRQADFQWPSKVLLVDDEREFVQTLSERLLMRKMGAAVVYNGEEALDLLAEDQPEVMVLDLKMPGVDGIEVLKRVKQNHPEVEVIILTGHGSEQDRDLCMGLGAFAYLQKPVDIDLLSQTMQQAYDKICGQRE